MTTPPGALTAALDELWRAVRTAHPALPAAHVVLSPTRRSTNHGADRWSILEDGALAGLVVDAEVLAAGPDAVLTSLLHDAAHVLNWVARRSDVTMRGRYHNGTYLEAAQAVGLVWQGDGQPSPVGYADPVLSDVTRQRYANVLAPLEPLISDALPFLAVDRPERQATRVARLSIACQCVPPRLARVSRTVLERGPIICGVCGKPFAPSP